MVTPISFLSDFGHDDEFVGVVHGVIARIESTIRVVDIGHNVPRGNIRSGAMMLLRAIQYLPGGVALAVVDPGVGTDRKAIAVRTPWGHFVGPDNGLLAPAVAMVGGADLIVSLEDPRFRLPGGGGATFDGRDLFAPAAAVLASGEAAMTDLGPTVPLDAVTPLMIPLVEVENGAAQGEVLWVDGFGNAQTNISPDDLAAAGLAPGDDAVLRVGAAEHTLAWVRAYGDVASGEAMVHVDSYGQIAVAVRDGRADEDLPLATGVAVTLRPIDRPSTRRTIEVQGAKPLD